MTKRLKAPSPSGQDLDKLSPDEIAAMPTFTKAEDQNWWSFNRRWEKYVQRMGDWTLFERSQKLAGFPRAMASVRAALVKFHEKQGGAPQAKGEIDFREAFFSAVQRDSAQALKNYEHLITRAAKAGDVEFFLRIHREIRNSERRRESDPLDFYVLAQWIHGFLWLMSDATAYSSLRLRCDFPFTYDAYEQSRKRLKLAGYRSFTAHPVISGHTKTGFKFRPGWTNLEPNSTT